VHLLAVRNSYDRVFPLAEGVVSTHKQRQFIPMTLWFTILLICLQKLPWCWYFEHVSILCYFALDCKVVFPIVWQLLY